MESQQTIVLHECEDSKRAGSSGPSGRRRMQLLPLLPEEKSNVALKEPNSPPSISSAETGFSRFFPVSPAKCERPLQLGIFLERKNCSERDLHLFRNPLRNEFDFFLSPSDSTLSDELVVFQYYRRKQTVLSQPEYPTNTSTSFDSGIGSDDSELSTCSENEQNESQSPSKNLDEIFSKNLPEVEISPWIMIDFAPGCESEVGELAVRYCHRKSGCWLRVPLTAGSDRFAFEALRYWHCLMESTNYHLKIFVALELPDKFELLDSSVLDQWISEPVDCIILSSANFITDPHFQSEICLKPSCGKFLERFLKIRYCSIVLKCFETEIHNSSRKILSCLKSLRRDFENPDILPSVRPKRSGRLYTPMQPLHDHLQEYEYAGFEQDETKYRLYEEAGWAALHYLRQIRNEPRNSENPEFIAAVLGAGRGPLVDKIPSVADKMQAVVRVHVVDKNPNALAILRKRRSEDWIGKDVLLHSVDMRDWKCPDQLDLIVHEMLGCFGDDECSPECLENPQRYLKPGGFSIPSAYTSYLMPVSSTVLYGEVLKKGKEYFHIVRAFVHDDLQLLVLDDNKPVFSFCHSRYASASQTQCRTARIPFTSRHEGYLHGFVGTFSADMFGIQPMSTSLTSSTFGLISWCPVFIPLSQPVYVRIGDQIEIEFSRRRTKRKVWYEWRLLKPVESSIHNLGGAHRKFPLFIKNN